MSFFIDLAIPSAVDRLFTYAVPARLQSLAVPGVRALAPFGKKTVMGVVTSVSDSSTVRGIREIHDIVDEKPVVGSDLMKLAEWIAEYYHAPLGSVLKAMLVRGFTGVGKSIVSAEREITDGVLAGFAGARAQRSILSMLQRKKTCSVSALRKFLGSKGLYSSLHDLRRKGFISLSEEYPTHAGNIRTETFIVIDESSRERWREQVPSMEGDRRLRKQCGVLAHLAVAEPPSMTLRQLLDGANVSRSVVDTLARKGIIELREREVIRDGFPGGMDEKHEHHEEGKRIVLNTRQKEALDEITAALERRTFSPFLLRGVTGSGKTQVYIDAIKKALSDGGTALVLVPEISLTPQTVGRFRRHFGERVISIHSRMSQGERYDAWRLAREGRCPVVIGPRSAVFAPVNDLRLIIVDEEHESSYKQFDQSPRYHARDVALVRAKLSNASVVLGSATPSCESYFNALSGKYRLLELPERVDGARLPEVKIIDMVAERNAKFEAYRALRKEEFKKEPKAARLARKKFRGKLISDLLLGKITDRLNKGEGTILLQNRRGFSAFIECVGCGRVEMCDRCQISLTYHRPQGHLRCHYCGLVRKLPLFCPDCGTPDYHLRGFGTQRVEEELRDLLPGVRLERMDLDTTARKGSHARILNRFASGTIDILLGTQMIAKGLDIPRVTLVGVISADTQLLLPDFRSSERTFQLLTQVAGRSGRRKIPGEVVIQTTQPDHAVMRDVTSHDFVTFYGDEIEYRRELAYPPFTRITLLEFSGRGEEKVRTAALECGRLLEKPGPGITILGPSPAALPKIRDRFRWHIVLKVSRERDPSGSAVGKRLAGLQRVWKGGVRLSIDTDPQSLM